MLRTKKRKDYDADGGGASLPDPYLKTCFHLPGLVPTLLSHKASANNLPACMARSFADNQVLSSVAAY